jgi:hypothetical protein
VGHVAEGGCLDVSVYTVQTDEESAFPLGSTERARSLHLVALLLLARAVLDQPVSNRETEFQKIKQCIGTPSMIRCR